MDRFPGGIEFILPVTLYSAEVEAVLQMADSGRFDGPTQHSAD